MSLGGNKMTRYRNTWAEINIDAIVHNILQLRSILPSGRKMMGVVKADGYGHGSVAVAKAIVSNGVDFLMVAFLEEAITLRENGINVPILVIGRTNPVFANIAAKYDITISVFQPEWIDTVMEIGLDDRLSIHVEFETGFNRTGIRTKEELEKMVQNVKESAGMIEITGAYTHFATADEIFSQHYKRQKQQYEEMLRLLANLYEKPIITHIGNSAAGIQYPDQMLQYTRFGVSLYGMYPSKEIKQLNKVPLLQAFSLYSELINVKKIHAGEFIGYGATYEAKTDEWIGTIPIGYADGWSRALQGFYVLIDGKKQPIVGRICMDMMMVKLDKYYEVGQKVTLIGKSKGDEITIDHVASYLQTINYEIPCMITSRVPREYVTDEEI